MATLPAAKFYLFVFALATLGGLELTLGYFAVPEYLFPKPSQVFKVLVDDFNIITQCVLYTATQWAIGIICALLIGVLLSLLSFRFKVVDMILSPILLISQSTPYLVFVPLLMIWFGLGMAPKIILVTLTCVFPIALVLKNDLIRAHDEYRILVHILQLPFIKALRHIYFPYALPGFFNALKVSVSYAFGSTVIAELMGSAQGLGNYLLIAQNTFRTSAIFAVALVIVCISFASVYVVNLCARKCVFWEIAKK